MNNEESDVAQRMLAIACCVLGFMAPSVLAQPRGTRSDPISGTWTGELGMNGATAPVSVTFQLKFDGKDAVSGTVSGLPNPADVKKGTFDPKTGALKLQLGKKDDSAVLLTLEGTVAKGVATGRFSGEMSGEFKMRKEA
jgi:hypothetical protein